MSTPSLRPLTNRDFKLPDDGYYHILPPGVHPHPSGLKQVVDDQSQSAIMNAFAQDKAKKEKVGDDGILLADYDHFSNDANQKSEAAGWIEDFQKRDDGIYAKIRWSDDGLKDVKGGVYRYVSPVWNREDCEDLGDKQIRPLRIDRVGLTNDPNIKGMRPLSNRSADPIDEVIDDDEPVKLIAVKNYGTRAGALKGWDTRGRGKSKGAAKDKAGKSKPKGVIKKIAKIKPAKDSFVKEAKEDAKTAPENATKRATPPPLPKAGTPERTALQAGGTPLKPSSVRPQRLVEAPPGGAFAEGFGANNPSGRDAPSGSSYLRRNIFNLHFHNRKKTTSGNRVIAHKNSRSVSNHTA